MKQTAKFDPRTIAILISAVVTVLGGAIGVSYFAGYSIRDMEKRQEEVDDIKHAIDEVHLYAKELVEQEVGGLRSDWERDRKEIIKRLDKFEK